MQDLDEFMARELRCKVIELNRSRNNVVLSRRAVLEDERKEMRQAILDRLSPGDVIEGQISNIVDFGAFVDLDGIDLLVSRGPAASRTTPRRTFDSGLAACVTALAASNPAAPTLTDAPGGMWPHPVASQRNRGARCRPSHDLRPNQRRPNAQSETAPVDRHSTSHSVVCDVMSEFGARTAESTSVRP